MEKSRYEECEIEVILFESSDIICDSNFDGEWGNND